LVTFPKRQALSLDGTWEFIPDPERTFTPDRLPGGRPIAVPGAWEAQLADPYGIVRAWYRRWFSVPTGWDDGHLILRFGSAMARAVVWLDGRLVGDHDEGYLPFEIDAGAPRAGTDRDLVVRVDNPVNAFLDYPAFGAQAIRAATDRLGGETFDGLPRGKQTWYTSTSGLLGPVVVELVPDPWFAALLVQPDLDAAQAMVRWRLAGPDATRPGTVSLTVVSPEGKIVSFTSADARAGTSTVSVPNPEPWGIFRPALYRLDARLSSGPSTTAVDATTPDDVASVRFGMRSVTVRDGEILLNGRPTYIRGALDQDFWPAGRSDAPSRQALERQVQLAREMGLNLLRCHIKIPAPAYLDVADEAGMLVWCELPSWTRLDADAAALGRRMLARMVETMGHHPSIIAWTVINEDWGADLRHSADDRRWLVTTAERLKSIDPGRLVIDNSPCETKEGAGFHLRTDLADFHAYRSMPDRMPEWRAIVEDLARRPAWLWSPDGDGVRTGDEAVVLSEFGGWGLPSPTRVGLSEDREPWWWQTGQGFCRPAGIHDRFERQGLGRIWPDVDHLAEATQWRQFDGLAGQIRELRRHPSIKGYVITELCDAFWEANGLLDVDRGGKVYHDRLVELNGADVLVVDLPRFDLWSGEAVACEVVLSSFPDATPSDRAGGELTWRIRLADGTSTAGSSRFPSWPRSDAHSIGPLEIEVPSVGSVMTGELVVTATSSGRDGRAINRASIVVVPDAMRQSACSRRIAVSDPLDRWSIGPRLSALGHQVGPDDADLIVSSHIDRRLLADVERGRALLLLARSGDAISADFGPARSMHVRPRRPTDRTQAADRPWDGDWTSVFAWALPGVVPGITEGGLLGDPHRQIFPDHVLDGLDVLAASDGVEAGLFAGWVHDPAALLAAFRHGDGRLVATTLRLSPEDGPIATTMLESLIQKAGE
jgi:hypothetical protein